MNEWLTVSVGLWHFNTKGTMSTRANLHVTSCKFMRLYSTLHRSLYVDNLDTAIRPFTFVREPGLPDRRRMFHVFKYLDVSEVGTRQQSGRNNMSCEKAPVRRVRRVTQMKLPVETAGSRIYAAMCGSFSLLHRKQIVGESMRRVNW